MQRQEAAEEEGESALFTQEEQAGLLQVTVIALSSHCHRTVIALYSPL